MTLSNVITVALLLYVVLVVAVYLGQRSMIYYPDSTLGSPAGYGVPEMQEVGETTPNRLVSWYGKARDKAQPVIVLFHGNAGHIGYRGFKARTFLDAGYGVLLVGYRGYGGNAGSPSELGFYEDARIALQTLETMGITKEKIVLYGESIGTGVAVQMALEGFGQALVLEAPYSSLADVASHHYPIFPVNWLLKDRFESQEKINKIPIPKLIVHGAKDNVIPQKYGRRLFDKASNPKQWKNLERAGHNDLFDHGAGLAIIEFLQQIKGT